MFISKEIRKSWMLLRRFLDKNLGDLGGTLDSNRQGIVYLSESEAKLYYQKPDQKKEEMISSKVSGNDNGFSFNRASLMDFDFYENFHRDFEEYHFSNCK